MANDIELNSGSGGAIIATDITSSSEHHQKVKVVYGTTGTFNMVSTGLPFPVVSASSGIVALSSAIAISSGTVTLSSATSLSSGTVTLSSAPGFNIPIVSASSGSLQVVGNVTAVSTSASNPWSSAPSFNLPIVSASSGLIQISGIPIVVVATSSGMGSSTVRSLSSGTVTLSSATSLSSGTVTLSSAIGISSGTITSTAATNPWSSAPSFNVPIVSASSGLVQISGSVVSASSGVVQVAQVTSSGQSMFLVFTTGGTTVSNLTTAASNLKSYMLFNSSAVPYSVKVYNSTAPTAGSTTAMVLALLSPGSTGGAGANMAFQHPGPYSSNGWSIIPTANLGATSTGAAPTDVAINITYQT